MSGVGEGGEGAVSRFYDGSDEIPNLHLYDRTLYNAILGKRGQAMLRKLERALLLLPRKRLIRGALAEAGEVCALGAFALQDGLDRGEVLETVQARLEYDFRDAGENEICDLGVALGWQRCLAWQIGWQNDEGAPPWESHEARWRRLLQWVQARIS